MKTIAILTLAGLAGLSMMSGQIRSDATAVKRSEPMITKSIDFTTARSDDCEYTERYARCSYRTWERLKRADILAKVK